MARRDELALLEEQMGVPPWPPVACPGADKLLWEALSMGDLAEEPMLDFGEVFAGEGRVSASLRAEGFVGRSLDVAYSPDHDVLTPVGLLLLLKTALELRTGGVLWAAPPCSTWVFLSRGSTLRTRTEPEGNRLSRAVVAQNALVERLCLVLEILCHRGVHWIIEQPAGSCMWDYPAMAGLISRHRVPHIRTDFGAFPGSESLKPTILVGTAPYLWALERACTSDERARIRVEGVATTTKWKDGEGKAKCQGTPALKSTQAYSWGLGAAHAGAFRDHYGGPRSFSGASSSTAAPAQTGGRPRVSQLLQEAPHLHAATADAWFLRDFLGEAW